jgi:hypothetical protein
MRRGLTLAVVAALVLAFGTANAQMYGSLRYAGTFSLKEFAFGMQAGAVGAEASVGYSKYTMTELEGMLGADIEPSLTIMSLGAAGFFQIAGNERYAFDVGGRVQYISMSVDMGELGDIALRSEDTIKASISGMAYGPVLRGRWFLVEDAIAIGPEVYVKFSNLGTSLEAFGEESEDEDMPNIGTMELEYSLRMDFYF